jgi:hypothetical protein
VFLENWSIRNNFENLPTKDHFSSNILAEDFMRLFFHNISYQNKFPKEKPNIC